MTPGIANGRTISLQRAALLSISGSTFSPRAKPSTSAQCDSAVQRFGPTFACDLEKKQRHALTMTREAAMITGASRSRSEIPDDGWREML